MTNMRISAIAIACAIAGTVAIGQGQSQDQDRGQANGLDPFFDHGGARGEVVHVLPTPSRAAEHSANGPFSFAPPSSRTAVYAASYGTGNLIDHGGPVIQNARFQAIFWTHELANEAANSVLASATLQQHIEAFITRYGGGADWNNQPTDDYAIVQQYGTRQMIASTLPLQSTYVDEQPVASSIDDAGIQTYLTGLMRTGVVVPDESVVYGVYFPAGMAVKLNGTSCTNFCGYHNYFDYNGMHIKYAAFPYLSCSACKLSNLSVADMLTIVTSHEVREAVTDQQLNAWFDKRGYEGDDKCAWHNLYQVSNGGFWVQPEYSNGGLVMVDDKPTQFPGPGCVVPNAGSTGGGGGGTGHGHGHGN